MRFLRRDRESPTPAATPSGGGWTVAQGEYDGQPLLLRFNEGADRFRRDFQYRLGLAVPFAAPTPEGFPGDEDQEDLAAIEDRLDATLEEKGAGVMACVVTTGGMREFVSYLADGGDAARIHSAVESAAGSHEVQAHGEADPAWSVYEELRP